MTSPLSPTAATSAAESPTPNADAEGASAGGVPAGALNGQPRRRQRSTSHLKQIPQPRELREALRRRCSETAAGLDKSHPLDKHQMERLARRLLDDAGQPEGFLGWTMVVLASEFWRDQVAATPPKRRLLLLPRCLNHDDDCPPDPSPQDGISGANRRRCDACSLTEYGAAAEKLGYQVLVAEGSARVMQRIVSGEVDAIVGVASLNELEKAIDNVLLAGIPCLAAPLLACDGENRLVDDDWVLDYINARQVKPTESTHTYLHLLRGAKRMFEPQEVERLLPRRRSSVRKQSNDPLAATEQIAYEFLTRGGKYARPFITLAAFDAASGGDCTAKTGAAKTAAMPDAARRVALSIEAFHKASLVHDDIQDDDDFRYGMPTLHKQHGVATAINIGDYLIGLGYQIVACDAAAIGAETAADILHQLSTAHTRLCEGQGAELMWRDRADKRLTPRDAIKIYALKTSPAFQAALYGGVRLAVDAAQLAEPIHEFSKHLGIAFQILNDLKDWQGDSDNKLAAGGDVIGGRPTLLLALAIEALDEQDTQTLLSLSCANEKGTTEAIEQVRQLYEKANVFESARQLVDEHQDRAEQIAKQLPTDQLCRLARYLVDSVLELPAEPTPRLQ